MVLRQVDIRCIVETHHRYNGILADASRRLPYAPTTILKYWTLYGLEARVGTRGGKTVNGVRIHLKEIEKNQIISYYEKTKSMQKTARELHYSIWTVHNVLRKRGVKAKNRK